jgi:hypothetical protein
VGRRSELGLRLLAQVQAAALTPHRTGSCISAGGITPALLYVAVMGLERTLSAGARPDSERLMHGCTTWRWICIKQSQHKRYWPPHTSGLHPNHYVFLQRVRMSASALHHAHVSLATAVARMHADSSLSDSYLHDHYWVSICCFPGLCLFCRQQRYCSARQRTMPTCIPLSGCGFRVGTARRGMSTGGERSMPVLATTRKTSDDDTM